MLNEKVAQQLKEMKHGVMERLDEIKSLANKDLEIDEVDLDSSILKTPKLHMKYNDMLADEMLTLKDMYAFKEKTRLERWKYYMGKQSDEYMAKNGIMHEKILKSDVDKYMAADDKMELVNDIVNVQKSIVDYLERCIKEIQSRSFHIKTAVEWRRFTSGG